MNYPLHELIDRLSILQVRMEHEPNEELQKHCLLLSQEVRGNYNLWALNEIRQTNRQIWELEADIRSGKLSPLDEVGRAAIEIRELNNIRVSLKRGIALSEGEYYPA